MIADDQELLRRYAKEHYEEAFTELVGRRLNLVWGAALRITNDAELARDVAQTVFTDLARKASSLPRGTVLAGWLYRAACYAAAKAVRRNVRRAERESQAMRFHTLHASDSVDAQTLDALQPLLDEALGQLADDDRDAVVLRYFASKSLAEVGAALGTSDAAAQKRLTRARLSPPSVSLASKSRPQAWRPVLRLLLWSQRVRQPRPLESFKPSRL